MKLLSLLSLGRTRMRIISVVVSSRNPTLLFRLATSEKFISMLNQIIWPKKTGVEIAMEGPLN